jgi:DNA-binding ferritin-like protein (Dps family)
MKIYKVIFLLLILFFLWTKSHGQENYYYLISNDLIPIQCDSDLTQVKRLIEKGEEALEEARKVNDKLSSYKESDSVSSLKILELKEKIYRHQLKASTYFEDAHQKEYRLLKGCLEKEFPGEYAKIEEEVKKYFQSASVLRKRALNSVPSQSPLGFMAEASAQEKQALELMGTIFPVEEDLSLLTENIDVDSLGLVPDTMSRIAENDIPLKPDSLNVVEDKIVGKNGFDVFFSIQFLATRGSVTDNQVRTIYNGVLPVVENHSDGWHRFAAGSFKSIKEAEQAMRHEGIYGFIVAFRDDERITLTEARRLLKK